MNILEKYTGEKNYVFPDGKLADQTAVLERYPTALDNVWIVHTDEGGEILLYLYLLSNFRSLYSIDPALNESEAIQAIQDKMNEPPPPAPQDVLSNEQTTEIFNILLGGSKNE